MSKISLTTGDLSKLLKKPGSIYSAPGGTALPVPAVGTAAGIITSAWLAPWIPEGYTDDGFEFHPGQIQTDNVEVEELLDPASVEPTGRVIKCSYNLVQITPDTFARALNGAKITRTGAVDATTGVDSRLADLEPLPLGSEVRRMIGWQSNDDTMRVVLKQCFQTGDPTFHPRKGANKATLGFDWTIEAPADGTQPWKVWMTGARSVG